MDALADVEIQAVEGGITAPLGFHASGVACGIKTNGNADMALVAAEHVSSAAAIFTTNLAKAAPVLVSKAHLDSSGGLARAIVTNSGCANACTGPRGLEDAAAMAQLTAAQFGCDPQHVLVASTGVIGVSLDMDAVGRGIAAAGPQVSREGHAAAAQAIMTTDPFPKAYAVEIDTAHGLFRVGGMAKGSGMIEPQMATMLGYLTTDAEVEPGMLHTALVETCRDTFNAITVDGESSTNDCVFALANGASGVVIDASLYPLLVRAMRAVAHELAMGIVRGGEGATKLMAITVTGADTEEHARRAARVVANSPLVKTAIHGADPNWGRLVAAAGRSGVAFDIETASVRIGPHVLFEHGGPHDERALDAAAYLTGADLEIEIDMGTGGNGRATVYTCDLSAEYVRINAEYRT